MKLKNLSKIILATICIVIFSCSKTKFINTFKKISPTTSLKTISYKNGNQKFTGVITSNHGKNLPGVLILPSWMGIDEEAKNAALDLEKEGYIAFIADIYGEGNLPKNEEEASVKSTFYKQNYKEYQFRITLALNELTAKLGAVKKTAIIGYCFGGTGALEATRGNIPVEGVVSIHGGLYKSPDRRNNVILSKILVLNPDKDQTVSKEDYDNLIKEMNEGNVDWQIITYANSKHTFTNPQSLDYNPIMAKRAWQHMLLFLKEVLK